MNDNSPAPDIPEAVRRRARNAGLDAWMDGLPALIEQLAGQWGFTVGRTYTSGSEAFVADAALDDGTEAVLKLLLPHDPSAIRHEITALRLADGQGCARLLRADEGRGAMLLERLGPTLESFDLPFAEKQAILISVVQQVWRPAAGYGLPTGAEKARWLATFVADTWESCGRPCAEPTIDLARHFARRREDAHDDERAVLVHGDAHAENALQAGGTFKLVDPDGLLAEPEYDIGVILRWAPLDVPGSSLAESVRATATNTGLDPVAIWQWAFAERVSTGLVCTSLDLQPAGREMLAAADAIAQLGLAP